MNIEDPNDALNRFSLYFFSSGLWPSGVVSATSLPEAARATSHNCPASYCAKQVGDHGDTFTPLMLGPDTTSAEVGNRVTNLLNELQAA